MQLKIYKDYDSLSSHAANEIIELVKNKPDAVLCLASGNSPTLTYQLVIQKARDSAVDFNHTTFVGLDEWVGIPPENEGSCHFYLYSHIFKSLQIDSSQIHLFNALSNDLPGQCEAMDKIIAEKGGIDLMLVGVGMNGHIGFNEPGVAVDKYSHVIDLDETTQSVGQKKYFQQPVTIKQGITLGLKHFLEARKAIMIANGNTKAGVMKKVLEEEININMPASIVRSHKNSLVMIDEEAASMLNRKNIS